MSELFNKRALFTSLVPKLIERIIATGEVPLLGRDGLKHKPNSLHFDGLAVDIDLFRNGIYLTKTSDHTEYGEYWKSLHPDCRWGGDFQNKDGNHYSITYQGRQ